MKFFISTTFDYGSQVPTLFETIFTGGKKAASDYVSTNRINGYIAEFTNYKPTHRIDDNSDLDLYPIELLSEFTCHATNHGMYYHMTSDFISLILSDKNYSIVITTRILDVKNYIEYYYPITAYIAYSGGRDYFGDNHKLQRLGIIYAVKCGYNIAYYHTRTPRLRVQDTLRSVIYDSRDKDLPSEVEDALLLYAKSTADMDIDSVITAMRELLLGVTHQPDAAHRLRLLTMCADLIRINHDPV